MQDKRRWLPGWPRVELVAFCLDRGMSRREAASYRRVSVRRCSTGLSATAPLTTTSEPAARSSSATPQRRHRPRARSGSMTFGRTITSPSRSSPSAAPTWTSSSRSTGREPCTNARSGLTARRGADTGTTFGGAPRVQPRPVGPRRARGRRGRARAASAGPYRRGASHDLNAAVEEFQAATAVLRGGDEVKLAPPPASGP
jgi:hypothetical protein